MEMARKSTPDRGKSAHKATVAWNGPLIPGTTHLRHKFSNNGGQDASDGSWRRKGKGEVTSGRTMKMRSLDSAYRQRVVMQRDPQEPVSAFREVTWEIKFSQEIVCWFWFQNKYILVTFFKIIQLILPVHYSADLSSSSVRVPHSSSMKEGHILGSMQ